MNGFPFPMVIVMNMSGGGSVCSKEKRVFLYADGIYRETAVDCNFVGMSRTMNIPRDGSYRCI